MSDKFYKLPQDLTARKDLNASDKIVYAVIMDHRGNNNKSWPGKRTLARETGLSGQTICESIKRLELSGDLSVNRRGNGKSNHYESGLGIRPVKKLDRSSFDTIGGQETRPEAVKKLDPNQTDLLNQTKYSPNSIEYGLSELLLNLILERKQDFKKPDLQKWAKHIDLMIRRDKRKSEIIEEVIRWSQQNDFWQSNILSTEKLRIKFDTLELQKKGNKYGCNKPDIFSRRNFKNQSSRLGTTIEV